MSDAFLEQITADPDDDTNRLVFADWLEEDGQFERAEFIRVQVQRATLPAWDAAQVSLKLREQELIQSHGEQWLAEMPEIPGVRWDGFRRGIVAMVSFASFEALRNSASVCRRIAPVESVRVHWPRRRDVGEPFPEIAELRELVLTGRPWGGESRRLADSPQLTTLQVLRALGLDARDLGRLAASPHLSNLRTLCLTSNGVGTAGVRSLVESATMTQLETLDLTGPGYYESYYDDPLIDVAGMEILSEWKGLASLKCLLLSGSDVRAAGLSRLLRSPLAGGLKTVSLRSGRLTEETMAQFADASPALKLDSLDLGENIIGRGAETLAAADCLRDLKVLKLDRCEIPEDSGVRFVQSAAFLDGLRMLDVSHNHFGNAGLQAMLERASSTLHTLRLRNSSLNEAGVAALAHSPASNELIELDLAENGLTSTARQALGTTPQLQRLLVLHAGDNKQLGYKPLAISQLGRRLMRLNVEQADPWYEGYLPPEETMPYFDAYTESGAEYGEEDWDDDDE
ncbi:MAG: TIGR02996 domain-containing protein [Planctomycetaceae bacterium]|nr:TIGR02996 domain-containing protein [Planctomycetaceae bacterium]